jgi:hypothetical protein
MGAVIFVVWVWGVVFLFAAIPGVVIGWVASAMLGYRRGIVVFGYDLDRRDFAIQKGFPGSSIFASPVDFGGS